MVFVGVVDRIHRGALEDRGENNGDGHGANEGDGTPGQASEIRKQAEVEQADGRLDQTGDYSVDNMGDVAKLENMTRVISIGAVFKKDRGLPWLPALRWRWEPCRHVCPCHI